MSEETIEDFVHQAAANIEEEMLKVNAANSYFPQDQMRLLQARAALRAMRDNFCTDQQIDDMANSAYKAGVNASKHQSTWLPIESAPRDGTWVLGLWFYSGKAVYRLVAFDKREFMQSWHQKPGDHSVPVQFWQSLPPPPTKEDV